MLPRTADADACRCRRTLWATLPALRRTVTRTETRLLQITTCELPEEKSEAVWQSPGRTAALQSSARPGGKAMVGGSANLADVPLGRERLLR